MATYSDTDSSSEDPGDQEVPVPVGNDRLSFGVELEFVIATLEDGEDDPYPSDPRPVFGLRRPTGADASKVNPKPGNMSHRDLVLATRQYNIATEKEVASRVEALLKQYGYAVTFASKDNATRQAWHIKPEALKNPDDIHYWVYLEVNSPAYYFGADPIAQTKEVCKLITKNFRAVCNQKADTGLHVHVGNGLKGFDLLTLRNAMALLWTFEKQFDELHPKWRKDVDSYSDNLRTSVLGKSGLSDREGLEYILEIASTKQLFKDFAQTNSKLNYNLSNLRGDEAKKTIEFRQHEGTLSPTSIENWIKVCVGILEFASAVKENDLETWAKENIDKDIDEYDVVQVLCVLGLYDQAVFYGLRMEQEKIDAAQAAADAYEDELAKGFAGLF